MCWMFGLDDLDVFDVLYVLDDLDDLDVLDVLDVLVLCWTLGNIVFEVLVRFPFQKYITSWVFSGFSCSRAISGLDWIGYGLDGISVWGYCMSTALRC